jgi:type II secretory pathway pseudopilin PulG
MVGGTGLETRPQAGASKRRSGRREASEVRRTAMNENKRSATRRPSREAGFTLVEIVIILVIIAIIAIIGIPAIYKMLGRSKLQGATQEVAVHLLMSRLEAMKMGFPVVVVPDYDAQTLFSFVDEDDDRVFDAGTDDEVYRLPVPGDTGARGVFFMGEDGIVGTATAPAESIDGLTPAGGNLRVAVFEPNGSIRNPGAFRLSDGKDPRMNLFEIRIAPQATARIEVRKWVYGGGGNPDAFRPYGAGLWDWY